MFLAVGTDFGIKDDKIDQGGLNMDTGWPKMAAMSDVEAKCVLPCIFRYFGHPYLGPKRPQHSLKLTST